MSIKQTQRSKKQELFTRKENGSIAIEIWNNV